MIFLWDSSKASFVVEGFSPEELEERADKAQFLTAQHQGGCVTVVESQWMDLVLENMGN